MNANQLASYQNANYTLKKTRQIVLLYDAAIRFMQQAGQAIEEQDFERRYNLTQKVSNILSGLYAAIDHENGGQIAKILSSFYTGLDLKVISINRTNNLADVQYIIEELKNMRNSWEEIDKNYDERGQKLEASTAPNNLAEPSAYSEADLEKAGADYSA